MKLPSSKNLVSRQDAKTAKVLLGQANGDPFNAVLHYLCAQLARLKNPEGVASCVVADPVPRCSVNN